MPEPLLLRARASLRAGDLVSALRDLEEGMAALGRHREQPMSSGVLHVERALFTDAMTIAMGRGDHAAAFAYAERSRGGAVTLAAMQQRLAGTGTVLLAIVALPPDVVTFAISERDMTVAKRASTLPLYERLIAPVEHVLAGADRVIVVPDRSLEHVSFAALYDERRKQYLIERFEVAIASSASSLQPPNAERMRTALAMALPSGDEASLPETEGELADVSAAYASVERDPRATLARLRGLRTDVLHIAGHTARERGAGEQALLFADGRASWKAIAALAPLRARVVVLAACETMRRPDAAETRALSLAGAFAGAGARDVIGTLDPIADRHARVLFGSFHRHLAGGASPAAALRAAQREGIAGGAQAWKSVALLTSTL
jgi:CHAT domain